MIHRIIILCVFMILAVRLIAQIEVSPLSRDIATEADIYNLQVNNLDGSQRLIYLELKVRKNNQIVYESRTNQYLLVTPVVSLSESQLQPVQVFRNELKDWQGDLQLEIKLLDHTSQEVLFVDRFNLTGQGNTSTRDGKLSEGLDFQHSGRANIYGQFSNRQGEGSFVPQNYIRAEIHPDFQFQGIPIGLDILLSTEQNAFRQSINQVALRFDAQQLKRSMRQRLQNKIKEIDAIGDLSDITSLNELKEKAIAKAFPKLREWESQLKDPEIINGLKQLKQMESLRQVIDNPEVQTAIKKQALLLAKKELSSIEIDELERLNSFVTEIEKLNTKQPHGRKDKKREQTIYETYFGDPFDLQT